METFQDLVEANFGAFMSAAASSVVGKVTNKGKDMGNRFLAGLGSARAAGRLDLNLVYTDLVDSWKYFLTTQSAQPTVANFLTFLQTVFGMQMDEDAVYLSLYGKPATEKPVTISPNKAVIDGAFGSIVRARANPKTVKTAADTLEKLAGGSEADQTYIVLMIKFLMSRDPNFIKMPGLEGLKPYAHGGILSKDNTAKLLKAFASVLIKRQMILDRMDAEKEAGGGDMEAGEDGKPSAEGDDFSGLVTPTDQKTLLTPEQIMKNLATNGGLYQGGSLSALGGVVNDEPYWAKVNDAIKNRGTVERLNYSSSQLMHMVATFPSSDFIQYMAKARITAFWPEANVNKAWAFAKKGGDPAEIMKELDHFADTADKGTIIMVAILRFISWELAGKPDAPKADNAEAA